MFIKSAENIAKNTEKCKIDRVWILVNSAKSHLHT